MAGGTNAPHANEVNVYTKLQLVIPHNAVASRTIRRGARPDEATWSQWGKSRMKISTRQRWFLTLWGCCLIGLQYKWVLKGINLNAVIAAENRQRQGFGERDSPQRKIWVTIGRFKNSLILYHILFLFYFVGCMDVYMQSNAWQRSCVRSPAIKKKPKGQRGGGREESRQRRWRRRGRAAAEEASVFLQERGCRAK